MGRVFSHSSGGRWTRVNKSRWEPLMRGFKLSLKGCLDHSGSACGSHASRAAMDEDVTGSGIPGGWHGGRGALPCLGQHGGVEEGPYLGYGGGSGVWKGRWGGSHYFWSPHCYCRGRSRASACLSKPLQGGGESDRVGEEGGAEPTGNGRQAWMDQGGEEVVGKRNIYRDPMSRRGK